MQTKSGFHIAPGTTTGDAVRAVCDAMTQVEFEAVAGQMLGQLEMQVKDIGDGLFTVRLCWVDNPVWAKREATPICTFVLDPVKQQFLGPNHFTWTPFGARTAEE